MDKRKALVLAFLLLSLAIVLAEPDPVTGLNAGFVGYKSVKVTWNHEGGEGMTYSLYRGSSIEEALLIASTGDKFYTDSDIVGGQTYIYFVIAVDSNGSMSTSPKYISITPTPRPEKPFKIVLISPEEKRVGSGELVDFVVGVDSNFFDELHNLNALLINEQYGINKPFEFDSQKRVFILSMEMPVPEGNGESTTTFKVVVRTDVLGEEFSDEGAWGLVIYKSDVIGPMEAIERALPVVLPPLALLVIGIAIAFFFKKWVSKKREEIDGMRYEIVDLMAQRSLLKYDLLKKRISEIAYADRDKLLKNRITELEKKLGLPQEYSTGANPFAGFNRAQIAAIGELVKTMGSQRREMAKEQMQKWLEGRGRSEKVAKKTVELVYEFARKSPKPKKEKAQSTGPIA